jgi:valacyclovir hydrolase
MQALGIDKYSMLGWCNGGCTALIAASKASYQVDKVVVWSCNAYVTGKELDFYETTLDVREWPDTRRLPQFEKYVSETWCGWIDAFQKILDDDDGDVCRGVLVEINALTLILHGTEDTLVPVEHAVYLHNHIKCST